MNGKILMCHLITGLYTGGAEMMLYKFLSRVDRKRFQPVVVSLMDGGKLGDRIQALDIPVYQIGMHPGKPTVAAVWRLISTIQKIKPDIIQGWMYHGNLAAHLSTALSLKKIPIVWNIRQTLYSLSYEKKATAAVIKLLAPLSIFPEKILYNSETSASQHQRHGYRTEKTLVIPNGFDTELFKPSIEARQLVLQELNLDSNTILIGRISRFHEMKDHGNFLNAAAILLKSYANIHFVMAGDNVNWQNKALTSIINNLGINNSVHLLGERKDIPHLTAALDIACSSSSHGDAFPNIIGEAMSCGVTCVVTDVGDSARIIGDTGKVVPPKNSQLLANALKELIDLGYQGRETLGQAARIRVIDLYSLNSVVHQYENLYESLLNQKIKARG
ncbi:MAG: glycosyltransferase [Methylacidiphilales bacterium]|nr:glycosyltransferase [Candidatus Methylacidiphilales bacterium]NJR14322.1 glycosyltransferase [Calothrix sp. CSU_2_0]